MIPERYVTNLQDDGGEGGGQGQAMLILDKIR